MNARVRQLVNEAPRYVAPSPPQRFPLFTADDLSQQPAIPGLVKRTIPDQSVGAIFGPPGSGKSLLAVSALVAIEEGSAWFGLKTRRGPVLYVVLEGVGGQRNRIRALQAVGHKLEGFRFMVTPLDIRDEQDRAELIAEIQGCGVPFVAVLIDTLARSSPGADENSSQDMGAIIAGLMELQRALRATIITVHHSGKDAAKGPRGHSSLLAALDFAIEVRRDGDLREWQLIKAKDDADGQVHPFQLRVVDLDRDEDGDLISSCVIDELIDTPPPPPRAKPPSGGNQRIAWLAVMDLLSASQEFGKGPAPINRKCVTLEAAIDAAGKRFAVDPKRRRERAITAITGLAGRGCIVLKDEVLWLP